MKKKILLTLTAILSTCMLAFTLTGCFDSPHTCVFDKKISAGQFLKCEATCENKAVYYYSCECGKSGTQTFEFGSALGHHYEYNSLGNGSHEKFCVNDPSDVTIEDCVTGEIVCQQQPVCSVCYGICGEPKEHDFSKQIVNQNTLREPATCTTSANYYYSCECGVTGCDDYFSYGEPLEHEFVDYVSNNDATCEENGTKTAYCNRDNCNEFETIEDVDSALGHAYGEYIYNNDGTHYRVCANDSNHVENNICSGGIATCTSKAHCASCNEPYGNKLSHTFEDDECNVCGTKVGSQGLLLELVDYGRKYRVAGLGTCTDKDIVIPDEHNNIPVTHIDSSAFVDSDIESVWIPYSVLTIQTGAFEGCQKLKSVTFGENLKYIWADAFKNCKALESVNYTSTIDKWVDITFANSTSNPICYGAGLYIDNELVTEVVLNNAAYISSYAFYGYGYMESVTIPNSVKSIGYYAFIQCSLASVNYLGTIDDWAEISFSQDSNPISFAPLIINGQTVVDVNLTTATKVSYYAFKNYKYLRSVNLSSSVKSIGRMAFSGCESLISLTLGSEVTNIDSTAFTNCIRLLEVVNNSTYVTIEKSTTVGDIGYFADIIVNRDSEYSSELYEDNGYVILASGQEKILANYVGTQTELVLPNEITKINDYAIANSRTITKVILGENVTIIDTRAFYDNTKLKQVVLNNNLKEICEYAFVNCPLEGTAKDGLIYLTSKDNYFLYLLGVENKNIETIEIDSKCLAINSFAFDGCKSIKSVEIPNGVKNIGAYAFRSCTNMTSIELPSTINRIGEQAFEGCTSLNKVNYLGTADEWVQISLSTSYSNPTYYAKNLYINDELVTDVVLTTATEISHSAFFNCESIESIYIPKTVTTVGRSAFAGCTSLTIYCEADEKPTGWDDEFNYSNCPTMWGQQKDS